MYSASDWRELLGRWLTTFCLLRQSHVYRGAGKMFNIRVWWR